MLANGKRKVGGMPVPRSMCSYLMGAVRTDFEHLRDHIVSDCPFVATKEDPNNFGDQLLEELFRYLYLLADNSCDGTVCSSPSYFVDQAFHCLLLDPVLYFQVCDAILTMQGKATVDVPMRVLPHDALGGRGDDQESRRARYLETVARYKQTFKTEVPLETWSGYSSDPVAVQAEVDAEAAQVSSKHAPHLASCRTPSTEDDSSDASTEDDNSDIDSPEESDSDANQFGSAFDFSVDPVDVWYTKKPSASARVYKVAIRDEDTGAVTVVGVASKDTPLKDVFDDHLKRTNKSSDYIFLQNGVKLHYGVTVGDEEHLHGYQPGQTITCARSVTVHIIIRYFGTEDIYKVSSSAQFRTVMQKYAKRKGMRAEVLRFLNGGNRMNESDTVAMMYGNSIDVVTEQKGC